MSKDYAMIFKENTVFFFLEILKILLNHLYSSVIIINIISLNFVHQLVVIINTGICIGKSHF